MKSRYQPRFYRDWIKQKDLVTTHIVIAETDIFISSDVYLNEDFLKERILNYRKQIKEYILADREFLKSLEPIEVSEEAPQIIKDMADAAKKTHVGPMAAVAGAIVEYLAMDLKDKTKELIIENGGDIFLKSKRKRLIGIFAGDSKFSGKIIIELEADKTPIGICTSSSTVGHSLNFGITDATVILAKSTIFADAVATATANIVKKVDDIKKAIDFVKSIRNVRAAIIIVKDILSAWGDLNINSVRYLA
jgi:hypothetical protein